MGESRLPTDRPLLPNTIGYHERPVRAQILRQVADSLNYMYVTDLKRTPGDHMFLARNSTATPPGVGGAHLSAYPWVNNGTGSNGSTSRSICSFFVPKPDTYAQVVRLYVYCKLATSAYSFTLYFQSTKGTNVSTTVDNTSLGGTEGWIAVDFPSTGDESVSMSIVYVGGGSDKSYVKALSGWWSTLDGIRSDITIDTAWTSLTQTHVTNGTAVHAYLTRWLQRKTMQLVSHRPRPVVAKWFPDDIETLWRYSDSANYTKTIGRYKVYVSEHVPSLSFAVHAKISGSGTYKINIWWNGVLSATTITVSSTSYAWTTPVTFTVASGERAAVNDIRLDIERTLYTGDVGAAFVAGVSVWEDEGTATTLGLPGAEIIPTAYPPVNSRLIRARQPIFAVDDYANNKLGMSHLIKGVLYLAAKRMRHLVADSRYNFADFLAPSSWSDLISGDGTVMASYYFRTSANAKKLRFRSINRFYAGVPVGLDRIAVKVAVVTGSSEEKSFASFQDSWMGMASEGLSVSSSATCEIRVSIPYFSQAPSWPLGLIIEELPLPESEFETL